VPPRQTLLRERGACLELAVVVGAFSRAARAPLTDDALACKGSELAACTGALASGRVGVEGFANGAQGVLALRFKSVAAWALGQSKGEMVEA